jgi:hypothetical protein
MGVETQRYIRKPLYVEAVQITEENFDDILAWVPGKVETQGGKKFIRVFVKDPKIPRQTQAFVGDWILWTERGGHKVYTPKAFQAAFDLAEPEQPQSGAHTAVDVEQPAEVEPVAAAPTPVVPGEDEEEPRLVTETDDENKLHHEPQPDRAEEHDGKRVLTLQEQRRMSAEDVRDLVTAGEVVLEQDIAA